MDGFHGVTKGGGGIERRDAEARRRCSQMHLTAKNAKSTKREGNDVRGERKLLEFAGQSKRNGKRRGGLEGYSMSFLLSPRLCVSALRMALGISYCLQ
jgi:hypothetical protein